MLDKISKILVFASLVAVLPAVSQATVIVQTYAAPSGFNGTSPLLTTSNAIPQVPTAFSFFNFRSATGYVAGSTLNSVTLSLAGTSVQTINVSNTSGALQTANKVLGDGFIRIYNNPLGGAGATNRLLNAAFFNTYLDTTNGDAPLNFAPGDPTVHYGATTALSASSALATAPFDATGSFTWSYTTFGEQQNAGGNLDYATLTKVGGLVTLAYDFTAPVVPPPVGVPEPFSILILGVGLAGLGAVQRAWPALAARKGSKKQS